MRSSSPSSLTSRAGGSLNFADFRWPTKLATTQTSSSQPLPQPPNLPPRPCLWAGPASSRSLGSARPWQKWRPPPAPRRPAPDAIRPK